MVESLLNKHEQISQACARHNVARRDVFGSALRDDFRPGESDVDLLVEFRPMDPFRLADAYFGLLDELRGMLGGEVDLVMAVAVKNRYVAANIQRTKQSLYAA
jgi:predicted nucleotidyltransferase